MLIDGHLLVGTTLMSFDDLHGGLDHFDQAIALFPAQRTRPRTAQDRERSPDLVPDHLRDHPLDARLSGPAAERANAALALAAELDHPFTSAYARFHAGLLRLWRHDSEIALDLAVGLRELAEEHEFRIWIAAGGCPARGGPGPRSAGSRRASPTSGTGLDLYGELRSPPIFWPFLLFLDARASVHAGRPADGLGPLDTAIEILSPGAGASILPELFLLKGDLLAALRGR